MSRSVFAQNLISELESAVATRSVETGAMLRRVTDLFLLHAGHYSDDQLELYDGGNEHLQNAVVQLELNFHSDLLRLTQHLPIQSERSRLTTRLKSQSPFCPNPMCWTMTLLPIA